MWYFHWETTRSHRQYREQRCCTANYLDEGLYKMERLMISNLRTVPSSIRYPRRLIPILLMRWTKSFGWSPIVVMKLDQYIIEHYWWIYLANPVNNRYSTRFRGAFSCYSSRCVFEWYSRLVPCNERTWPRELVPGLQAPGRRWCDTSTGARQYRTCSLSVFPSALGYRSTIFECNNLIFPFNFQAHRHKRQPRHFPTPIPNNDVLSKHDLLQFPSSPKQWKF